MWLPDAASCESSATRRLVWLRHARGQTGRCAETGPSPLDTTVWFPQERTKLRLHLARPPIPARWGQTVWHKSTIFSTYPGPLLLCAAPVPHRPVALYPSAYLGRYARAIRLCKAATATLLLKALTAVGKQGTRWVSG